MQGVGEQGRQCLLQHLLLPQQQLREEGRQGGGLWTRVRAEYQVGHSMTSGKKPCSESRQQQSTTRPTWHLPASNQPSSEHTAANRRAHLRTGSTAARCAPQRRTEALCGGPR